MARWRQRPSPFPSPMDEFHEEEWPQVPGECLGCYGCNYGSGYTAPCSPRPGEYCGQLHYESLARDYPDRPERLAWAKRADAVIRWRQARLSWAEGEFGEGDPIYTAEWVASLGGETAVRHGGRGGPVA